MDGEALQRGSGARGRRGAARLEGAARRRAPGGGEGDDDLLDWCEKLDFDDYHDNWLSLACSGGSDLAAGLPELAMMEDFEAPT